MLIFQQDTDIKIFSAGQVEFRRKIEQLIAIPTKQPALGAQPNRPVLLMANGIHRPVGEALAVAKIVYIILLFLGGKQEGETNPEQP